MLGSESRECRISLGQLPFFHESLPLFHFRLWNSTLGKLFIFNGMIKTLWPVVFSLAVHALAVWLLFAAKAPYQGAPASTPFAQFAPVFLTLLNDPPSQVRHPVKKLSQANVLPPTVKPRRTSPKNSPVLSMAPARSSQLKTKPQVSSSQQSSAPVETSVPNSQPSTQKSSQTSENANTQVDTESNAHGVLLGPKSAAYKSLLPQSDGGYIARQRSTGETNTGFEGAMKVEIRYNSTKRILEFTSLTAGLSDEGHMQRVMQRFEHDLIMPNEAYGQKLNALKLFELRFDLQQKTSVMQLRGSRLAQVNTAFEETLNRSLNAVGTPARVAKQAQVVRVAFLVMMGSDISRNETAKVLGELFHVEGKKGKDLEYSFNVIRLLQLLWPE